MMSSNHVSLAADPALLLSILAPAMWSPSSCAHLANKLGWESRDPGLLKDKRLVSNRWVLKPLPASPILEARIHWTLPTHRLASGFESYFPAPAEDVSCQVCCVEHRSTSCVTKAESEIWTISLFYV